MHRPVKMISSVSLRWFNMNKILEQQIARLKVAHEKTNSVVSFYELSDQLSQPKVGPLAYEGVVLKDNISTKGMLTTASSNILENYVPVYDATIVKKLKAAGAVFLAKTTLDELAMGGTGLSGSQGATFNPYDQRHQAGGSSGGSAALAGSRVVNYAIGSDTGDSVRKPASYCGVVGFKPSYGRISRYGVIPYASSLDHVAFFTLTIDQSLTMLKVLEGFDPLDVTTIEEPLETPSALTGDLSNKTLGVLENVLEAMDNPELLQQFEQVLEKAQAQGATIKRLRMDQKLLRALLPTYSIIANSEATANHANLDGIRFGKRVEGKTLEETIIASRTAGFGSSIKKRFITGAFGLEAENQELVFKKAQKVRRLIVEAYDELLKEVDGIVVPATPTAAPRVDQPGNNLLEDEYLIAENHLVIGNFGGYPSVTLPLMFQKGLPIGLNITTAVQEDVLALELAKGMETLIDFEQQLKEVHNEL